MGYYIRAFCKASKVPDLASIQAWLRAYNSTAVIDEPDHAIDAARSDEMKQPILNLATTDWEQIAVVYRAGKLPILAECNRNDDSDDCLANEEIAEFVEFIGKPGLSVAKRKVLQHLAATTFIIACQLPTSDIDEIGYEINSLFLRFFVDNCDGMIQADGEGFYRGNKVIVPLE
jgi:hypothetical protein